MRSPIRMYLLAIPAGLVAGNAVPAAADTFGQLLWPVLGLLLYTTFTQIPLTQLPGAFRDTRFLSAMLGGNFLLVPLLVWGLAQWLPDDPALRLGVLLVLLVPCTDWFIAFTHQGGGDTRRAIAATPLNLLLQFLLLPVYLGLIEGAGLQAAMRPQFGALGLAFAALILLPLLLAAVTEWRVGRRPGRVIALQRLGRLSVPLLAGVIFLVAASQAGTVMESWQLLGRLFWIFAAYLIAAAILARLIASALTLDAEAGRTLAFGFGSRNSFVVLPLALALPPGWEIAAVVIVFQSLIELCGLMVYLWWIPKNLFPK